jgi:lipopolysaccharide/colanic/teichoic acid biosynthesis glycosyltransferase
MSRARLDLDWGRVRLLLVVVDAAAVLAALGIAFLGRYRLDLLRPVAEPSPLLLPICLLAWMAALAACGLYEMARVGSGFDEYRRVTLATTLAVLAVVVVAYGDVLGVSRGFLVSTWLASVLLLCAGRFLVRRVVRHRAAGGARLRRVLVIGANRQGTSIATSLDTEPAASSHVCGFLDDYRPRGDMPGGFPVLGDPMRLHEVVEREDVTHVVVVEAALTWESLRFIGATVYQAPGLQVLLVPGMMGVSSNPLRLAQLGRTLLLAPHATRIVGVEAVLKRLLDVAFALCALTLTLPIQLGTWLWLRWKNGQGLRWQAVRCQGNSPLRLPTFGGDGPLDRLPALWLMLTGQVSLVGPRPIPVEGTSAYDPWLGTLTALKPGFIGPWWLFGNRPGRVEEEVDADLRYARSYTAGMDLLILWRVLGALGARCGTLLLGGTAPATDRWARTRRAIDVVVAALALALTSPLLAVASALIWLEDRGPVFHRRRVLGRHGVEFDALKLRTMRVDADGRLEASPELRRRYERNVKLDDDPRVTRVGRVLRKLSFDELPQFVNVLRGEMSVVGPRIIHRSELERFGSFGPERLSVRPGITGLWQVSGRQQLAYERRVELDREYLRRRSLRLDLWLMLRTVPAVLGRTGAL